MSEVYFISDLHIGHKSIVEFAGALRGGVSTLEEHDNWIIDRWNSKVGKNDLVYVLGDVCFDKHKLPLLKKLKGNKHLILGNHDEFSMAQYQLYFNKVHGFMKYKGHAWLSHSPIHPNQLRDKWNIHGHVHHNSVQDYRYINVSAEVLAGVPLSWTDMQSTMMARRVSKELTYIVSERA